MGREESVSYVSSVSETDSFPFSPPDDEYPEDDDDPDDEYDDDDDDDVYDPSRTSRGSIPVLSYSFECNCPIQNVSCE